MASRQQPPSQVPGEVLLELFLPHSCQLRHVGSGTLRAALETWLSAFEAPFVVDGAGAVVDVVVFQHQVRFLVKMVF